MTAAGATRAQTPANAVAVIVGSAYFDGSTALDAPLHLETVETPFGSQQLHRLEGERPAYVLFRHGVPHSLLPHEINYRAQAWALKAVRCGALLITSSAGVLDAALPLYQPLLVRDLLMPENRLPDGSACTMFTETAPDKGHLMLDEGPFSPLLNSQLAEFARQEGQPIAGEVVFAYVPGPRGKTRAENHMWSLLGAQANSMTLGPEVVLAGELGIPCAALVAGHKHSLARGEPVTKDSILESLLKAREALRPIVVRFLRSAQPVPCSTRVFRFR